MPYWQRAVMIGGLLLTSSCMWTWRKITKAERYAAVPVSEVDTIDPCPRIGAPNYERIGVFVRKGKNKNTEKLKKKAAKHGGHAICFLGEKRVDVMLPDYTRTTVNDVTYVTTTQTASPWKRTESRWIVLRWVGKGERQRPEPPKPPPTCADWDKDGTQCGPVMSKCEHPTGERCWCKSVGAGNTIGEWSCY